jgi:alkylation response protein AidB-like acyl-CoA dehydrogenase
LPRTEVKPLAKAIDAEHRVPHETIKKAAALGLMGVPFPQEYGGMGGGETGYCIMMEELGKVCTSTATVIGAHTGIAAMAIHLDGTEEQKQNSWCPWPVARPSAPLASPRPRPAPMQPPSRPRRCATATTLHQRRQGVYHQRRHRRHHHRHGRYRSGPGRLRRHHRLYRRNRFAGLLIGSLENKMGIRGSSTAECVFEDVRVPKENVLGQFGAGFLTFMKTLDIGRASLGAACLGGAEAVLEAASSGRGSASSSACPSPPSSRCTL